LAREQKEGVVFEKANLAAAFQKCCADHLADRLKKALEIVCTGTSHQGPLMSNVKHIVIAGGVAANQTVRRAVVDVAQSFALTVCVPPAKYCTDNGVMVAWTGIERLKRGLGEPAPRIKNIADAEMYSEARPRWPLGVRHSRCLGKINDSAGRPLDRKAQDMSKGKEDSLA
jgi:tRNA A37 threonylcarbamoyltransferase TsaD